jgi:carbonic anhydrase
MMAEILRRSSVRADLEAQGAIQIAGAMYDLETGVTLAEPGGPGPCKARHL